MVNDSSLGGGATQFAFDIDSQKGVMTLLASVRASELTPEQKNELRDLAFLYINGGKDQSVRISLEQKVSSYGLQPLKPVAVDPVLVQPASPFGTSRPAPIFSFTAPTSVVTETSSPRSEPASVPVSAQTPSTPPVPEPTPAPIEIPQPAPVPEPAPQPMPEPTPAPQPAPVPVVEVPVISMPEPVPPPAPAPEPEPIPEPVVEVPIAPQYTPAPIPEPEPTLVPEPEPVPAPQPATVQPVVEPAPSYDSAVAMQRIREIKALVNERVGNPVNLVDINNDVGREYMAALLDAMKRLNSGTSVISAMKRLEDSFKAVEKTLDAHDEGLHTPEPEPILEPVVEAPAAPQYTPAPVPEPEPTLVPEPEPVPTPQPATESVREVPAAPEPEPTPVPVLEPTPIPEFAPTLEPVPEFVPAPEPQSNTDEEPARSWVDTMEVPIEENPRPATSIPIRAVPAGAPAPIPQKKREGELESAWGPATDTLQPAVVEGRVLSLAESEKKLHSLSDLPTADEVSTSATGDPLFTKEVDDGMQQLLLEWPLFKKSGLFGTGPKGREHPLFKKIAALQIPLLLAGRFEGATQEVKQSITDYMNGWRYEQGIIYEQGETFEHYLRRVIRHILDLQKKRHNS